MFKKYISKEVIEKFGDDVISFIQQEVDAYEGKFQLFNVATQQLFVNNCITEFTKKNKK
jgi:hypothetical protein